MRKIALQYYKQ